MLERHMKLRSAIRPIILTVIFLLALLPAVVQAQSDGSNPVIVVMTSKGAVTPVLIDYLERGISTATARDAEAIILQLDTPGGSVDVMNEVVQIIRNSDIPVIVFVSPENAMAGSAGTIITLAGHVAAMAPGTTIGAASPVGSQGEDIEQTMESKVKEILKASVRNLTASRPPEAVRLAEETIESAIALTVDEALEVGLVDIKARNVNDLITQLDGREVIVTGSTRTLNMDNAILLEVNNTFIEGLLLMLVNPNLVFLLLSLGIQAILIEISSPGGWVAGFLGVVCILLAIYGLGVLPVNYFGLLFIVLAFVLFILELKTPALGGLTAAGVVSFITGALVLFNSIQVPGFPQVSVPLVIGMGIFIAATFLLVVTLALRAQRSPIKMGREALIGQKGFVKEALDPIGMVQVGGELWQAELEDGEEHLPANSRISVTAIEGLKLIVRKV